MIMWLYEEIMDYASSVWLPVLPRPMDGGVYELGGRVH